MDNYEKHIFIDDEGKEHEFEIIDFFEVEETEYAVLQEVDQEEALLLRVEYDNNEEIILVQIEDQDEFDEVRELYLELLDEED